jgi:hypothetical protein
MPLVIGARRGRLTLHGGDLEGFRSNSSLGYLGVVRRGDQLLIKHAFPAQCGFESPGGLVD